MLSTYILTDMFIQIVIRTIIYPIFVFLTKKNINHIVFEEQKLKYVLHIYWYINQTFSSNKYGCKARKIKFCLLVSLARKGTDKYQISVTLIMTCICNYKH
jgi:hypothetical protein